MDWNKHIYAVEPKREHSSQVEVLVEEYLESVIVLYNDEVNTFDWVIEALIEICDHKLEQAQQCAMITHYKGKCEVLSGSFDELRPKCDALQRRGLSAEIH